jgi:hypothetical protein
MGIATPFKKNSSIYEDAAYFASVGFRKIENIVNDEGIPHAPLDEGFGILDHLVGGTKPNLLSFDQRISTIDAPKRAAALGLDVSHPSVAEVFPQVQTVPIRRGKGVQVLNPGRPR